MSNEQQNDLSLTKEEALQHQRFRVLPQGLKDVFFLIVLFLLNCLVFYKTIFAGRPISHACLLANRDVLFREFMTNVVSKYDESVYLMVLPYYYLAASYIKGAELPLWNSFAGWGQPFAGDIILSVWSPLRFIFSLAPSMPMYNLILVTQIGLAASGTYLLGRALRLSRLSCAFAAISFAYCPFVVWFAELPSGTSTCFLPLLVWTFARLANQMTISRALLAGISSGVFILSGHPEVSFFGISMGSLIFLLRAMALRTSSGKRAYGLLGRAFLLLALAGCAAFCVCSSVFIEFITYALNGCSYKFAALPSTMAWQAIAINIIQPSYGSISPFAGTLCVPLLAVALLALRRGNHYVPVLLAVLLVFFIIGCRPGLLAEIFRNTVVNWLPGTYCTPFMVLAAVLLAGIGLDMIVAGVQKAKAMKVFVGISSAMLVGFLLLHFCSFDLSCANFENAMEAPTAFHWKYWIVNLLVTSASLSCWIFIKNRDLFRVIFPLIVIGGSFFSQAIVVKGSLPTVPEFHFKINDPVPFLQKYGERVCVIGFDVLSANDNAVFGINSLSTHSPLVLERYQRFMSFLQERDDSKAAAAGRPFNTVIFSPVMSARFDLSGVNYIVSMQPVRDARESFVNLVRVKPPKPILFETDGLKVAQAMLRYDPNRCDVTGYIDWSLNAKDGEKVNPGVLCNLVVSDEKGVPYWFGGAQVISPEQARNGIVKTNVEAIVPLSLTAGTKFQVRLQIYDQTKNVILKTISGVDAPILSGFTVETPSGKAHYQPIYESSPHHIRVYRNTESVGRAYIVFDVETAKNAEQSLEMLGRTAFNPHEQVILETKDAAIEADYSANSSRTANETRSRPKVRVVSDKPNAVVLETESAAPGMLVLTDAFYPGWKASIDGKDTEIYRANFHFRAVRLPAGSHTVKFIYQPPALYIGLALFLLLLVGGPVLILFSKRRKLKN